MSRSSRKSTKMDDPVIVGGGRYIVVQPGQAEIAFVVVDAYQGQGIGTILMRHLAVLARDAGLKELIAEVLPENSAMLKLFKKFGFTTASKGSPQVIHLTLATALSRGLRFMAHSVGHATATRAASGDIRRLRASSRHTKLPVKPRPYRRCRFE